MSGSLTAQARDAIHWRVAGAVAGAASQFLVGVVLARLLAPADFGVIALAYAILAVPRPFFDLGMGSAIVQRANLTERHVRTAFTVSSVMGLTLAAILAVLAPFGSSIARAVDVVPLLRVLSVSMAIRGTAVVAEALLRRQLDLRRLFIIETASYVIAYGGVSITLAILDHGFWSLAWGAVLQTLMSSGMLLRASRHPVRPLVSRRELADLTKFGLGASLTSSVNSAAVNADNLIVGRLMGSDSLGLYTRAYGLMNFPYTYASRVISGVMFPAFARVQDSPERLRRGYLLLTELTGFVAGPAMVILAVAAPALVPTLYGPGWNSVVVPLQILCAAGYFRALYHLGGIVAHSTGRVYGDLWRQVSYAAMVVAGAWSGVRFGLPGVAAGVGVAILYMFVVTGTLALHATQAHWRSYLRAQAGGVVTSLAVGSAVLSARVMLDVAGAPTAVIAAGILTAAMPVWLVVMTWSLSDAGFDLVRSSLPHGWVRRSIERVRQSLRSRALFPESLWR
jgi:PST family polysaccharide transporter